MESIKNEKVQSKELLTLIALDMGFKSLPIRLVGYAHYLYIRSERDAKFYADLGWNTNGINAQEKIGWYYYHGISYSWKYIPDEIEVYEKLKKIKNF